LIRLEIKGWFSIHFIVVGHTFYPFLIYLQQLLPLLSDGRQNVAVMSFVKFIITKIYLLMLSATIKGEKSMAEKIPMIQTRLG